MRNLCEAYPPHPAGMPATKIASDYSICDTPPEAALQANDEMLALTTVHQALSISCLAAVQLCEIQVRVYAHAKTWLTSMLQDTC